jgi:Zn-dependent metalloprotease
MRIRGVKKSQPADSTRTGARRSLRRGARGAAGAAGDTGLSGFAISAAEPLGRELQDVAPAGARRAPGAGFRRKGAARAALGPEEAALEHLDKAFANQRLPKLVKPVAGVTKSEFKSVGTEAMPLTGTTVVKFRQYFNKVPVYGSLVTVELDKRNACLGINSSMGTPAGVSNIAEVSPAQAAATVAKAAHVPVADVTQTPRLYYYYDQNGSRWCLAYILENVPARAGRSGAAPTGDSPLKDYVVDAKSGKLIADLPRTATMASEVQTVRDANRKSRKITVEVAAGGKRQLRDTVLNVTTCDFAFKDPTAQDNLLPGKLCESPPAPWPLEAIGAHANGAEVARFLRTVVLRNNIDNRGGEMISTVNCWDRSEGTMPPRQWKNAYWNGSQMVYGQILFPDSSFYSVASMLDVVGHEMFHGVTDHTSRLEYRTQAGALNESYSDIFGTIIANGNRSIGRWNWDIGAGFDGPGTILRSMEDPTRCGQPRNMSGYRAATPPYTYERNDYGWVHDNSGIHNYAAYRVITAKNAGKYVFTRKQIAALYYIALTVHLSRTSQFADSRRAVLQAARSLFRNDSAAVLNRKIKAIEDGFAAAGIV